MDKKVRHVDTLLRSYPNALSAKQCKQVVEYTDHMQELNIGMARHDHRTRDFQTNPTIPPFILEEGLKERNINPMDWPTINLRSGDVSKGILTVVNKGLEDYARELGINQQMPRLHTMDVVIQKSNADTFDQYSRWHSEAGELQNCDRAMAWMIYLNDDFEGGETEFKFQKHREIPEVGKLVIWPASFTHTHRGGMITDGIKYIATGWIHYSGATQAD